jgi:hypothetical protein
MYKFSRDRYRTFESGSAFTAEMQNQRALREKLPSSECLRTKLQSRLLCLPGEFYCCRTWF